MTVGYLNHSRMNLLERWICAGMRQTCCGPWQPSICLAQFLYIFDILDLGKIVASLMPVFAAPVIQLLPGCSEALLARIGH